MLLLGMKLLFSIYMAFRLSNSTGVKGKNTQK